MASKSFQGTNSSKALVMSTGVVLVLKDLGSAFFFFMYPPNYIYKHLNCLLHITKYISTYNIEVLYKHIHIYYRYRRITTWFKV